MNWLTKALSSSVGKKFVMGGTGLFLCSFLVIHLAGNLLLYAGPEAYNAYAHKIHSSPALLVTAEIILYLAFAAHIYLAIVTTRDNRAARQRSYDTKQSKVESRTFNVLGLTPDSTMFITGSVVLLFIIVHLGDFKFEWWWGTALEGLEPFQKAVVVMKTNSRKVIYGIGALFLGVHLVHGFASAFQSLGLNHPKYNPLIKRAAVVFAVVIAVGFMMFTVTLDGVPLESPEGPTEE
ncbi:succinate dehydrogenase cytochrome b subunit [Maioricimonas sp. JC845]|uniref:succinate dehydrogenase cytochrome b subunit n=1 Tax=Maioricimonas sp. JC845 TaxID=3232138 RepID=UPI00345AECB9